VSSKATAPHGCFLTAVQKKEVLAVVVEAVKQGLVSVDDLEEKVRLEVKEAPA